jgi:hypothetical protein
MEKKLITSDIRGIKVKVKDDKEEKCFKGSGGKGLKRDGVAKKNDR